MNETRRFKTWVLVPIRDNSVFQFEFSIIVAVLAAFAAAVVVDIVSLLLLLLM